MDDMQTGDDAPSRVAELEDFYAEGLIEGIPQLVKSGKEATVYRCAGGSAEGAASLAGKVYRGRYDRSFKNDAVYREGRIVGKHREQRALKNKSRVGREVQFGSWLAHEYETLGRLHAAGADVPRPVARAPSAILMEFVGDDEAAAPPLNRVSLDRADALPLFEAVLRNVELWLGCDLIHGDLSAYNMLYWKGRVTIIDFPQAVDARTNQNALPLLERDLANVCGYFARQGVRSDPHKISRYLWGKFLRAEL